MKRIIFLLIILILGFYCDGQQIIEKQYITTIKVGKTEGQIGFAEVMLTMGGRPAPVCFSISENNLVYIPDVANQRINVYDINFKFLRTVVPETHFKMYYASYLKINEEKEYIVGAGGWGVERINLNGKRQFYFKNNKINKEIINGDFFIFDDYVIYYDEKENVKGITSTGELIDNEEVIIILNQLNIEYNNANIQKNDKKDIKLKEFREKNNYIIIGDMIYTTDLRKYFKFIKAIGDDTKNKSNQYFNYDIFFEEHDWWKCIGYDKKHNKYICAMKRNTLKDYLYVFDKTGKKLISFSFDDLKDSTLKNGKKVWASVAPNGDVYFMRSDETGTHFWKVVNNW